VDPVEFYHQAVRWYSDVNDQASVTARSIVSRAYYAALLLAGAKAEITTRRATHEVTVNAYRRGPPAHKVIGNKLDQLRSMRTRADYELMSPCFRREAGEALKRSASILKDLGLTIV
jgi:hypothetical protein